jgi:hypothetical protein
MRMKLSLTTGSIEEAISEQIASSSRGLRVSLPGCPSSRFSPTEINAAGARSTWQSEPKVTGAG